MALRHREWVAGLFLLALNLAVCWRLLFVDYLPHFNSLEPFFFALVNHIRANWPHTGWYPCWNAGMPFEYTYQPLLPSLAHSIYGDERVERLPANGLDVEPLARYVGALEDPARPTLRSVWVSTTELKVDGTVAAGQIISVQVSYHPGWRAMVNGRDARVERDGLGFIAVSPGCSGACDLRLIFTGGVEYAVTRVVSVCGWIAVLAGLVLYAWRRLAPVPAG